MLNVYAQQFKIEAGLVKKYFAKLKVDR